MYEPTKEEKAEGMKEYSYKKRYRLCNCCA